MNFIDAVRRQWISKAVAGLLALSILILLLGVGTAVDSGELQGQFGFALMAACAVLSLSVLVSLKAPTSVFRMVRMAWLMLALVVFAASLALEAQSRSTVLIYAMVALSFPSSVVVAPLVGSLIGAGTEHIVGLVALWLSLTGVGFLQWFVALRHLFRQDGRDQPRVEKI
jgi:hypothetical protein